MLYASSGGGDNVVRMMMNNLPKLQQQQGDVSETISAIAAQSMDLFIDMLQTLLLSRLAITNGFVSVLTSFVSRQTQNSKQ